MDRQDFMGLYESYMGVYEQDEYLEEDVEEIDEGRTEEIRTRMQARYGKPESRDTLRQHVARKKYENAASEHQSGRGSNPNTGREGKLTRGQMMYKAHRSAAAMRGSVNSSYDYDLYDLVLEYLLDEGLCESVENAEIMMAHMSEEWVDSIIEGFKPTLYNTYASLFTSKRPEKAAQIDRQISNLNQQGKTDQAFVVHTLNRRMDRPEERAYSMELSKRNKAKLDARARRDAQRDEKESRKRR